MVRSPEALMSFYDKYLARLRFGCANIITVSQILAKTTRDDRIEDIDERIAACDQLIKYIQDVRRWLLYFKNSRR